MLSKEHSPHKAPSKSACVPRGLQHLNCIFFEAEVPGAEGFQSVSCENFYSPPHLAHPMVESFHLSFPFRCCLVAPHLIATRPCQNLAYLPDSWLTLFCAAMQQQEIAFPPPPFLY